MTFEVGMSTEGVQTLLFHDPIYLKILASSTTPVIEQVADQVVKIAEDEGIPLNLIGVDDSGTQSLADVIEMKMGAQGVFRTNFSTKPPDLPVSSANMELASKRYKNRITYLYYLIQEYAVRGQIRGLPTLAADQFCKRRIDIKMRPLTMESKAEMKKRLRGKSPDEADAAAIAAGMARERIGLVPGQTEFTPGGATFPYTDFHGGGSFPSDLVRRINNLTTSYRAVAR